MTPSSREQSMTTLRTPLADQDHKIDLIEHINNDHPDEVLAIARAYCNDQASTATLEDIFEEGCLIGITVNGKTDSVWMQFVLEGDLEEKVMYLAYDAMVRQGKSLSDNKKHYFEVVDKTRPSANMLRLVLKSQVPLPTDAPGLAWMFSLKVLSNKPHKTHKPATSNSRLNYWLNRLMLWWMRKMSVQRREKMLQSQARSLRYYTLRKAHKSVAALPHADLADVDIYIHGNTPGSIWAEKLNIGDIVHSTAESHEHVAHLQDGHAVLIADETALPTVASLLETWTNPIPPVVISVTSDKADQGYLPETLLPANTTIHRLTAHPNIDAEIFAILDGLPAIDGVWGALENDHGKAIRKHLRETHQLSGKQNRVKGYWKFKATQNDPSQALQSE
jgi:NADPH-dependent ferric siderophore reductase